MEERKGFGVRVGALIIDSVFLVILSFVFSAILKKVGLSFFAYEATEDKIAGAMMSAMIGHHFLTVIYFLTEVFFAASPGKMILGMKIFEQNGDTASAQSLILRYCLKQAGLVFFLLSSFTGILLLSNLGSFIGLVIFLGCFSVLGESRQALHDKIAKTAIYSH